MIKFFLKSERPVSQLLKSGGFRAGVAVGGGGDR
jgi:hypothetical protein